MNAIDSWLRSDVMISDWSGAALEYAFALQRPVVYVDTPQKTVNQDWRDLDLVPFEDVIRARDRPHRARGRDRDLAGSDRGEPRGHGRRRGSGRSRRATGTCSTRARAPRSPPTTSRHSRRRPIGGRVSAEATAATAARPRPRLPPAYRWRFAHLAALWGFGVSQPVFSMLKGNPEFLVVRGSTREDVVVFALAPRVRAAAPRRARRGGHRARLRSCSPARSTSSPSGASGSSPCSSSFGCLEPERGVALLLPMLPAAALPVAYMTVGRVPVVPLDLVRCCPCSASLSFVATVPLAVGDRAGADVAVRAADARRPGRARRAPDELAPARRRIARRGAVPGLRTARTRRRLVSASRRRCTSSRRRRCPRS